MKWTITIITLLLITWPAGAQDHKVTTGELYYNEGKFAEAVKNLSIALGDTSSPKPGNIPKA